MAADRPYSPPSPSSLLGNKRPPEEERDDENKSKRPRILSVADDGAGDGSRDWSNKMRFLQNAVHDYLHKGGTKKAAKKACLFRALQDLNVCDASAQVCVETDVGVRALETRLRADGVAPSRGVLRVWSGTACCCENAACSWRVEPDELFGPRESATRADKTLTGTGLPVLPHEVWCKIVGHLGCDFNALWAFARTGYDQYVLVMSMLPDLLIACKILIQTTPQGSPESWTVPQHHYDVRLPQTQAWFFCTRLGGRTGVDKSCTTFNGLSCEDSATVLLSNLRLMLALFATKEVAVWNREAAKGRWPKEVVTRYDGLALPFASTTHVEEVRGLLAREEMFWNAYIHRHPRAGWERLVSPKTTACQLRRGMQRCDELAAAWKVLANELERIGERFPAALQFFDLIYLESNMYGELVCKDAGQSTQVFVTNVVRAIWAAAEVFVGRLDAENITLADVRTLSFIFDPWDYAYAPIETHCVKALAVVNRVIEKEWPRFDAQSGWTPTRHLLMSMGFPLDTLYDRLRGGVHARSMVYHFVHSVNALRLKFQDEDVLRASIAEFWRPVDIASRALCDAMETEVKNRA